MIGGGSGVFMSMGLHRWRVKGWQFICSRSGTCSCITVSVGSQKSLFTRLISSQVGHLSSKLTLTCSQSILAFLTWTNEHSQIPIYPVDDKSAEVISSNRLILLCPNAVLLCLFPWCRPHYLFSCCAKKSSSFALSLSSNSIHDSGFK